VSRIFSSNPVLDALSLEIASGEFIALLGASGSGKTTFLRILAGLDAPDTGHLRLPRARTVVFQEPRLVLSQRVWRNVVIGLPRDQASREHALAALREVGLEHRADHWPSTLSGGEAQRAALARALVRKPDLLLLDEPFAALDALTRIRMQQLVRQLCRAHQPATLLVTHDVDEAILLADRVLVLREGRIAFDQRVTLPQEREATHPAFQAVRRQLLGELGVVLPPPVPATSGVTRLQARFAASA
jgi:sulfonate transport system ATP-binding protein